MKLFKQHKLAAAVAVSVAAISSGAGAVALNPDGLGEALVYPYYTVRGGQTSLITVVNTTNQGKAVKVRFREARNSNDVLDFNLYLSPYDVWTGQVSQKDGGAYLMTSDTSCTNPAKGGWDAVNAANNVYGKGFFPYDYDSVDSSSTSQGSDRTQEGYVEVIEMAVIPQGSTYYPAIKHVNGKPPCDANAAGAPLFGAGGVTRTQANGLQPPSGGLFGAVSLLNLSGGANGGVSTSQPAVAYGNFARNGDIQDPSSANPNFADHNSCTALVNDGATVALMSTTGGSCTSLEQANAFAAVNMASSVEGEYSFFASDNAGGTATHGTDWIITMPGKHYFTNRITSLTSTNDPHGQVSSTATDALPPFLNPASDGTAIWNRTAKTSCLTVSSTAYSREEDTAGSAGSGFSPRPPGVRPNALCYEANVISFGQPASSNGPSAVHASPLALWLNPTFARGTSGWMDLPLTVGTVARVITGAVIGSSLNLSNGTATAGGNATVTGLPVIGFRSAVARYNSGSPLNNYNDSVSLTLKRTVTVRQ